MKNWAVSGARILRPLQPALKIISDADLQPNIICVTTFKGGVGKTTYVCNLALEFMRNGLRVLIIDGDVGGSNVTFNLNQKIAVAHKLFHYCYDPSKLEYMLDVYNLTGAGAGLEKTDLALVNNDVLLAKAYLEFFAARKDKLDYDVILLDSGGSNLQTILLAAALSAKLITLYTDEPTSREKVWETIFNIAIRLEGKVYYPVAVHREPAASLLNVRGISSAERTREQSAMQAAYQVFYEYIFQYPYRPQSRVLLYPNTSVKYDPLLGQTPILGHPRHSNRGISIMANTLMSDLGIKPQNTGTINYEKYIVE
ncbi:nucleotide binding protein CbiA superfamily [Candidatus Termititenax aidoneus]|uniref:Nucleotide binding protein CbiA superfamily n=1 Tax=Termititenax aidoneus TaxID=2218524 RepID=A0A388TAZ4_TERA1|nr:nucleotide binding protein CbiA superfamily [Candidatus Termititenax aidoneus]